MRKLCILLIFLTISLFIYAEDIPQPQGWVNDFANVISSEYRNKLTSLIQELEEKTSTEIAVVTIESIAPYDEAQYARLLFDNWKPGKKGKDNGVLILLALKERRWRIETGYGVEGILPDGLCGEIGRNFMVPYFKQGRYGEGLYYGVDAISKALIGEISSTDLKHTKSQERKEKMPWPFYAFWLWIIFNGCFAVSIGAGLFIFLFFAVTGFLVSFWFGGICVLTYFISLFFRWYYWCKIPLNKRETFWRAQNYHGNSYGSGWIGGGFGSGGFGGGGGFGGFGGGGGGGGGAGGGF